MEWWQWAISTGAVVTTVSLVYGALHRELRSLDKRVRALEEGIAYIRGLLENN